MVCEQGCELGLVEVFLAVALACTQPRIPWIYMRIVLSPILVQQICFWLPIEPAHVKGTVAVPDNVLWPEATLAEWSRTASAWKCAVLCIAPGDVAHLFVTECRVKILLHALHQSGAVDIDHHIIAARFDPRKRDREEVGQEGPRE